VNLEENNNSSSKGGDEDWTKGAEERKNTRTGTERKEGKRLALGEVGDGDRSHFG